MEKGTEVRGGMDGRNGESLFTEDDAEAVRQQGDGMEVLTRYRLAPVGIEAEAKPRMGLAGRPAHRLC